MKQFTKLFVTKASSVDEEAKTVRFKISDNSEDRYGEVVDQKSWDFKNYLNNPIFIWGHNPDIPENVLGQTLDLEVSDDGKETYATVKFDTDINSRALTAFLQVVRGTLRCVSVGFINHSYEVEEDVPILRDNELVEISLVPIPANPRAVSLALKDGSLNKKDAQWLMDSMKKEVEFIEAELAKTPTNKEKDMSDEQFNAITGAIESLSTKVDEHKAATDAAIADLTARLPEVETDEAKAEREKAEAEAAEAKRIADEEEAKKKAEELAKSGEDDQGGAGDGEEFDESAELTPELQAEIDAALDVEDEE
jgi:HK97 family phage prohead protease